MLANLMTALLGAIAMEPVPIADGVEVVPGAFVPGRQPDGNSIVFRGPDGFVVVDTGRHAAHTARVLERVAGAPLAAVVNTHWHLDHVGGNPKVRAAHPGVVVYASGAIADALGGFLARYRAQLVAMASQAKEADARARLETEIGLIDAGAALAPDRVVHGDGSVSLGGRTFELHVERAATAGDVWLFDRATRTLVAGDLVTLPAPFLDTACPSGWRDALGRLEAAPFERLVPGHGPVMSRADFVRWRGAFEALLDCAGGDGEASVCVDGWVEATADLNAATDAKFVRGMTGYYVSDVLRGDAKRLEEACAAR
jgi:glyoxylase-like metal-dependent hydrolase (beta-lactamase superfamily II)